MKARIVGLIAAVTLCSIPAQADPIIQPMTTGFINVGLFSPFGQTFTAQDPVIDTVGVMVVQFHDVPDPFSVRYDLYSGIGAHGTPIASQTFTGVGSFQGFGDVSFGGVPVVVGNTYSLMLTESSLMGVFAGEDAHNPYPGGVAIFNNGEQPVFDLAFHIFPASPTPEPATTALLALGLAAVAGRRQRRRK